ncbi:GDSL esterase/lipase At1g29660-like [Impatiens glandulifera]|uniref:GDSL esterase/lipase At1g29660-like n=1 Tax=Impatiens glandulifera TaxID=253017 RepID=UPI001FB13BD5|nr:GDSL esterase/lipase At1g29660-like [Impatiens glandulifera]
MNAQLKNHGLTKLRIISIMKSEMAARNYLSKCIYTVGMGSNDYINNYLQPAYYSSSKMYTPDQFADRLINQYTLQLLSLYILGARKVAVFGPGLVGCTPAEIAVYGANASGCVDFINNDVQLFNDRLQPLVNYLNSHLIDAKYTYINIAQISSSSSSGGVNPINIPCCSVNNIGFCVPNSVPCPLRNESTFFDAFHTTTIANSFIGGRCYNAINSSDAQPYDISTLARLK